VKEGRKRKEKQRESKRVRSQMGTFAETANVVYPLTTEENKLSISVSIFPRYVFRIYSICIYPENGTI
jgi:hypothetical protein